MRSEPGLGLATGLRPYPVVCVGVGEGMKALRSDRPICVGLGERMKALRSGPVREGLGDRMNVSGDFTDVVSISKPLLSA